MRDRLRNRIREESYLSGVKDKESSEKGSDCCSDVSKEEYIKKMIDDHDSTTDKKSIERSPSYSSESLAKGKESIHRSCDVSSDKIVHRSIQIEAYITTMITT